MNAKLDNVLATISSAMGQQLRTHGNDPPEIFLLGSDRTCDPPSAPEGIDDLPKDPSWPRLLKFFSASFETTHRTYVEEELSAFKEADGLPKERSVDSLTMWRILCSADSFKIRHMANTTGKLL